MSQIQRIRALKNVLGSWLGLGTTVVVGFLITPFVLRHVGDSAYGIWVLLTAFTGYYGLLDLGLRSALIRYVARHLALSEMDELNRVVSTAFWFYTGLGFVLAGVTSLVVLFFDSIFTVSPEWRSVGRTLLLVVGFGTAVNLPFTMFSGVLEGMQRFSLVGWMQTVSTLVRAGLLIFFLERGYGILTVGIITMVMNLLSALMLMGAVFQLQPSLRLHWRDAAVSTLRTLGGFGVVTFWMSVSQTLRFHFDAMVIGRMISAEAVTFFSFGSRLSVYSLDVVQMMAQIFAPMAATADASGEEHRQKRLFVLGNRYSAFIALPLGAMFFLIGKSIIRVWVGERYVATGYEVLAILTLPVTIYLMQAVSTKVLMGMSRHHTLARVLMIEAVANLMLSIALAPRYGLAGVAWGTAIPLAAVNLLFLPRHMCRLLNVGLREFLFEAYFYPLLAVIPVSLAFWAANSWIHPVTWAGLAATLLLAGVVYGATLLAYYVTVERPLRIPGTPATPDAELTR